MKPGFAGIDNALYTADNTLMVFGDAKAVLEQIATALRADEAATPVAA
jgi:NAD(P) transhydrogenase subunit beta